MVVAKTTEIYTHVSQRSLANVKSPLDRILDNNKLINSNIENSPYMRNKNIVPLLKRYSTYF
jgi:hypothetical protein